MKKIFSILIITLILTGLSSLGYAQNMVSNPGFENWTGGLPDDWSLSGSDIVVEQESTIIHGGSYSAKITWTTTSTRHLEQVVPVTPDTDYTFSAWIYDNDPDGKSRLTLRWEEEGGSYITNDYSDYTSDNTEWQSLIASGTAPSNAAQAKLRISVYDVDWDGDATIYADDVEFTGPGGTPIMTKAYSLSTTELDVFYNQDLEIVNAGDFTLTGSVTITFSNAVIDLQNQKLVHLSGSSDDMVGDLILDNIYDSTNDTDYDFYAGITQIALTNTNYPDGHINNGILTTFQGIISANDDYNNVWVSDDSGPYNGVLIFDYDFDVLVAVGDEILFVAERDEYNNLTELKEPILISIISTGNNPYSPTQIPGSDISNTLGPNSDPAEQWEGQLVSIDDVLVAVEEDYYIGSDDSWFTTFVIGDNVDYQYGSIGSTLDEAISSGIPIEIIGVVDWDTYDDYYRINPRNSGDLLDVDDQPIFSSLILSQNYPNPISSTTKISYSIPNYSDLHNSTQIEIHNIKGELVRILEISQSLTPSDGFAIWDGKSGSGEVLSNGIYLYKLVVGNNTITKKMILLR